MNEMWEVQRAALVRHLRRETGGEVFGDVPTRQLYSTDASIYQIDPVAVFLPRTVSDLQAAVAIARDHNIPIVPRGGGTSLSGQAIGAGLVIDASKYLRKILYLDPQDRTALVEPGVVLEQLNLAAAKHNLQFGPDVSTANRATLGGMIGNNSAGSHSIVHGLTVDHVLKLDVIFSDGSQATLQPEPLEQLLKQAHVNHRPALLLRTLGQIIREHHHLIDERFPKILRRVSGYNLDRMLKGWRAGRIHLGELFVGSEGTLGLTKQATLKLVPRPKVKGLVVPHFSSIPAALDALEDCLAADPSAVEMMDQMILDLARENLALQRRMQAIQGRPAAIFMVELTGDSEREVGLRLARLESILEKRAGVTHIIRLIDDSARDPVWRLREAGLPLLMGLPGERKPVTFVEDTAVSPEQLPGFVAEFRDIMQRHGTFGAVYGHASVGCLHIRPVLNLNQTDDVVRMREISTEVSDLVLRYGGSLSGEHGDGLARSEWLPKMFGPELYADFKAIKQTLDPENLFNPGKIVDAPPMDQSLRYQPVKEKQSLPQVMLDYSRHGGIVQHVELCSGTGACRKTASGTMCPSYRATLDERDSTRGRANMLRLAFQQLSPPEALASPAVQDVLDLCLSCKACKAECPSNVDMAKLKAEAMHQYYQRHRRPDMHRLQSRLPSLFRWGSAVAPLANGVARSRVARWWLHRQYGMSRQRSLPTLHRQHLRRWYQHHTRRRTALGANRVLLFDDCFTTYTEPKIGIAAVQLLESLGHTVELVNPICCGRPLISQGYLTEARQLVQRQAVALAERLKGDAPLLGLEPSCLLTLVDEWPELLPGEATRTIARHARLMEDWLAAREFELRPLDLHCVVHGHCHHKSLIGMDASIQLLRKIPQLKVTLLDSGCCGMAGAFGYEAKHYDLSVKIAGQSLLPAVRQHPEAIVVASGTSCRHQLRDLSSCQPLHAIELVAQQRLVGATS
jgi:FAD/FMN-containing dehydrogenase/Fe-S oxidoreductase